VKLGSEGYPPDLEILVVGVDAAGASDRKLKFLRRIPIDPMTHEAVWGMRSYDDKPDSKSWGGQNVCDVYSKSEGTALDGTKYQDWWDDVRRTRWKTRLRSTDGFTLMELMIVLSLIVLLASIGLTAYRTSVQRGREAVLKEDLFRMRDAID
jgi:prepilin-type N-terminal cleavage/methylation domain-containing protein